jgi:hypothetical protein
MVQLQMGVRMGGSTCSHIHFNNLFVRAVATVHIGKIEIFALPEQQGNIVHLA